MLQWGRVRSDAESDRTAQPRAPPPGFNGAASDRTRNRCAILLRGNWIDGNASMGPRPIGRGIVSDTGSKTAYNDTLQWGRVRSDAESSPLSTKVSYELLASMGPRPIGRGIVVAERSTCSENVSLQWGRVRSDAESTDEAIDNLVSLIASMGPRPIGRGISAANGRHYYHVPGLQWGRVRSDAESACLKTLLFSRIWRPFCERPPLGASNRSLLAAAARIKSRILMILRGSSASRHSRATSPLA